MDSNQLSSRHTYARVPSNETLPTSNSQDQPIELTQVKNDNALTFSNKLPSWQSRDEPSKPPSYEFIGLSDENARQTGFHGWRKVAFIASWSTACACLVNIAVVIWFARSPRSVEGFAELYSGSCSKVKSLDLWVHLVINVLGTALLAASNYCMQCLTAPTRGDLNKAHRNGRWLDIGVSSFRNLRSASLSKKLLWAVLAATSLPLHLLYNSAFFAAYYNNEYQYFIAANDFPQGASFNTTPIAAWLGVSSATEELLADIIDLTPAQQLAAPWEKLTLEQCISAYAKFYVRDYRNLVVVTTNTTADSLLLNDTLLLTGPCDDGTCGSIVDGDVSQPGGFGYGWMCVNDPDYDYGICFDHVDDLKKRAADRLWMPSGFQADYCIAERTPEVCSFHGNVLVIAIVAGCNLLKALAMFALVFQLRGKPLFVVGDAVESFLVEPDSTTAGLCLLSERDVRRRKIWPSFGPSFDTQQQYSSTLQDTHMSGMTARLPSMRRISAVPRAVLLTTVVALFITVGSLLALFGVAYSYFRMMDSASKIFNTFSLRGLSAIGFGTPSPFAQLVNWAPWNLPSALHQVTISSLIANVPQLALSLLYVFLNRFLTIICLVDEWNDFVAHRKGLRVTETKTGTAQRSTYYLSLPYKISLPLLAISSVMHWLLSASFFSTVIRDYDAFGKWMDGVFAAMGTDWLTVPYALLQGKTLSDGSVNLSDYAQKGYASCGFSPGPMITVLVVVAVMLIGLAVVSCFKLRSGIPVVGSCSVAIAAACHRVGWDEGAEGKTVLWGAVEQPTTTTTRLDGSAEKPGHCCFTSGEVQPVLQGESYR